jgi:hypothetical protein
MRETKDEGLEHNREVADEGNKSIDLLYEEDNGSSSASSYGVDKEVELSKKGKQVGRGLHSGSSEEKEKIPPNRDEEESD